MILGCYFSLPATTKFYLTSLDDMVHSFTGCCCLPLGFLCKLSFRASSLLQTAYFCVLLFFYSVTWKGDKCASCHTLVACSPCSGMPMLPLFSPYHVFCPLLLTTMTVLHIPLSSMMSLVSCSDNFSIIFLAENIVLLVFLSSLENLMVSWHGIHFHCIAHSFLHIMPCCHDLVLEIYSSHFDGTREDKEERRMVWRLGPASARRCVCFMPILFIQHSSSILSSYLSGIFAFYSPFILCYLCYSASPLLVSFMWW